MVGLCLLLSFSGCIIEHRDDDYRRHHEEFREHEEHRSGDYEREHEWNRDRNEDRDYGDRH